MTRSHENTTDSSASPSLEGEQVWGGPAEDLHWGKSILVRVHATSGRD